MEVLIHAPQYRPNLSSIIRTAEFYGLNKVFIYDAFGLLDPPKNKKGRADMAHMARVWTAGAIEHIEVIKVSDDVAFLSSWKAKHEGIGRIVATLVDEEATAMHQFQFEPADLILFGNERDGLPDRLMPIIDAPVYLPKRGKTDCLNVAVTFGIVMDRAINSHG